MAHVLLLSVLLVAASVYVSESNVVVDESTLMAVDAIEAQTETGDLKMMKAEVTTTTAVDGQQSAGEPLTDDGSAVQTLDEDLSEVDEGRQLMERFYRRYNTTAQVDLVFVLDRSGSVPQKGWRSVVEFVKVGACSTSRRRRMALLKNC